MFVLQKEYFCKITCTNHVPKEADLIMKKFKKLLVVWFELPLKNKMMGVTKIVVIGIILLLQSTVGNAQGFYLKPSFSYGFALNKQEIINYGAGDFSYIQTSDYKETVVNGNRTDLYETVQKERVPLGKGKIFALEMGYESKKCLYYGLALSYGMMDKFIARSFYEQTNIISYENNDGRNFYSNQKRLIEKEQIVSPVWYGIEPSLGIYKKVGKYKLSANASLFLGLCRVRLIRTTWEELTYFNDNGKNIKENNLTRSNDVLTGTFMGGGSLKLSIEKIVSEKSALGLFVEYRAQSYIPTKYTRKYIYTYYHLLGSVVPDSFDKNPTETEIPEAQRRDLLFESFSIGVYWKRNFSKNNDTEIK